MAIRSMILGVVLILCAVGSVWVSRMLNGSTEEVLAGLLATAVAIPAVSWVIGKVVE